MAKLPRGVRIVNGYVQVRIFRRGRYLPAKNFGPNTPTAIEVAAVYAAEQYKNLLLGKIGVKPEAKRLRFGAGRELFFTRHYLNYRDESTQAPRSDNSIRTAKDFLKTLGKFFDGYYMDEVTVKLVKQYRTQRLEVDKVSHAAFNRERGMLQAMFTQFKTWALEEQIDAIKLPEENPCEFVSALVENKRERIPDTWELAAAYEWCQRHDASLWTGIESALLTALRKQDLVDLGGLLTVKGIQQKTGEKFDLPITLQKPVDLTNFKKRWNALRKALGWLKGSPKHTTWHDLRHWAPTFLGEKGFSGKIIQNYLGHSREETSERYTNIRKKALMPAVDVVKQELERIKNGD